MYLNLYRFLFRPLVVIHKLSSKTDVENKKDTEDQLETGASEKTLDVPAG